MIIQHCIANPLTTIRKRRELPHPGKVLMRIGDAVESSQVVAQTVVPPDFRIVEVAQDLDVPPNNANAHLKVERGQAISVGDVLASKGGLSSRTCKSPLDGKVAGVGRGRLLLQATPETVHVNALVPGYVVEIEPGESIVIETVGALIEALWGNGYEAFGVLRVVVRDAANPIRSTHINASSQGSILIGGSTVDAETVQQARDMRARGMIVGSVPASLIPDLQDASFPVIATEGIGTTPMNQAFFDLLRSLDGREAAVSGDIGDRWHRKRPYIVVPMPTQVGQAIQPDHPPAIGERVRVLRGAFRGRSGTIEGLPTRAVALETGAQVPGAAVDLGEDSLVQIPFANLERLF